MLGKMLLVFYTVEVLCIWFFGCVRTEVSPTDEGETEVSPTEEVELFNSAKRPSWGWTSEPPADWVQINLRVNSETAAPIYQGCLNNRRRRTLLSQWINRRDARQLLLDVTFALEEEPSNQEEPLKVYLFPSDSRLTGFRGGEVFSLRAVNPIRNMVQLAHIENYMTRNRSLPLGSVTQTGFHLGFSYSGTCAILASVRLYYRRCPQLVSGLATFGAVAIGSGPHEGSCVDGATSLPLPRIECRADGTWGSPRGECMCSPGHEKDGNTCKACRRGYYKPANESGGCLQCPPKSTTETEGAERCDCLEGYDHLPWSDAHPLGCTKPPSPPVNVTIHRHSNSMLTIGWDPPIESGGRWEGVTYSIGCLQKERTADGGWKSCAEDVVFLPTSAGLSSTEVNVTGLRGHCDYRLSVRTANAISVQQGARLLSEATVIVHGFIEPIEPPPLIKNSSFPQLMVGVVSGSLLLLVLLLTAGFCVHRKFNKNTHDQQMELQNLGGTSYRLEAPQSGLEPENVTRCEVRCEDRWLEVHSDALLHNLREVLVERSQLSLGKELGKGEFGSVYEGILTPKQGKDVKVAVKTIRGIYSQEALHEFIREAEIMKCFDHDNVVRLLGVTLEREAASSLPLPLVILPFMEHQDLRRFLIATRYGDIPLFVPLQGLLRFMLDISAGMEYLSSRGFLHRDLAARNCMLGNDLRVCVADFGLSKNLDSNNYYRQKVVGRSPIKWMAIESLSESIYTTKSDVWSFGVTMWEIVSRGQNPYPGVHNHELLSLLMIGKRLQRLDDCDAKLYEVMLGCWHHDPAQRPNFGALGLTLKELLSALPPLEAGVETHYINQGLEVAAAYANSGRGCNTETDEAEAGAMGNHYEPSMATYCNNK